MLFGLKKLTVNAQISRVAAALTVWHLGRGLGDLHSKGCRNTGLRRRLISPEILGGRNPLQAGSPIARLRAPFPSVGIH